MIEYTENSPRSLKSRKVKNKLHAARKKRIALKKKQKIKRKNVLSRRRLLDLRMRRRTEIRPENQTDQSVPLVLPPSYPGINQNLIVCSVTSACNLYRAKVMARSVKQHEPSAKVIICMVEDYLHDAARSEHVDEWILAKDLNIPGFYHNMFKYSALEGPTSMKAATLKYAMQKYADEQLFLYLDTDMRVYHPLTDLKELMNQHPILITPHVLSLSKHNDHYLLHGIFNSGILALTRSDITGHFLNWWDEKLYQSCYFDETHFADQGWLDFVPLYFHAKILRHPGYNLAAWNIGETGRAITHEADGYYFINDKPLCIFHYSGLYGFLQNMMHEAFPNRDNLLFALLDGYMAELNEMGKDETSVIPWSYDYFANGEVITIDTKKKYKENQDAYRSIANPYKESNMRFA